MALTKNKRRFIEALAAGLSGKNAAIEAGYSDKGAAQAAYRLSKDPDIINAMDRKAKSGGQAQGLEAMARTADPKEVLIAIMNDAGEEPRLRLEAAKALMPFMHQRMGDGKKIAAQAKAATVAKGKFAPAAPPRLKAVAMLHKIGR